MAALSWEVLTVHTTVPFVIARGGASDHRVVKVTLRDADGVVGWGEASPNRFYGETPETAVAAQRARTTRWAFIGASFCTEHAETLKVARPKRRGEDASAR